MFPTSDNLPLVSFQGNNAMRNLPPLLKIDLYTWRNFLHSYFIFFKVCLRVFTLLTFTYSRRTLYLEIYVTIFQLFVIL